MSSCVHFRLEVAQELRRLGVHAHLLRRLDVLRTRMTLHEYAAIVVHRALLPAGPRKPDLWLRDLLARPQTLVAADRHQALRELPSLDLTRGPKC